MMLQIIPPRALDVDRYTARLGYWVFGNIGLSMSNHLKYLFVCVLLMILTACNAADKAEIDTAAHSVSSDTSSSPPNFLIMISDDMGVETLASYGIGEVTAVTPNLDQLANSGVQFEHFWAQPTCSPTRATLLTGRYGFRTGVLIPGYPREDLIDVQVPPPPPGSPKELRFTPRGYLPPGTDPKPPPFMDFSKPPADGLPPEEVTFLQLLKSLPQNYATAAVGKWHLADSRNGWLHAPNEAGFDYYSGMLMGEADSFYSWLHVSQGEASAETGYIDERTVNDGIQWLNQQVNTDNPWLLWVAFVNPHTPLTLPPKRLLNSDSALALEEKDLMLDNTQAYAMAMIEAMDTLIGRLLDAIPQSELDNTYILFLGDNGSVRWAQPAKPVDPMRAKMTVYEGGIRVPLLVSGPDVADGKTTTALANSVDLFATILELAGANPSGSLSTDRPSDSRSFVSVLRDPAASGPREWIYADAAGLLNGGYNFAIRDSDYKLVSQNNKRELYDMRKDPWESNNILTGDTSAEQQQALARLSAEAESLLATK